MNKVNELLDVDDPRTALHWYDFLCPFCYVSQNRTAILERNGFHVVELPFQAHSDIPPGGIDMGPRTGAMYESLEKEAREAGLPLHWPSHLPNTKVALAAAEWTRLYVPKASAQFNKSLFEAHFALGENLEDMAVIDRHASRLGVDLGALHAALDDGSAMAAADRAQAIGYDFGVHGTPAWLVSKKLISGLRPVSEFLQLAG